MSLWKVIGRNLLFFRRHNLGITLAAAMCSLVLTGALTVGDSVRSTLRNLAEQRIGKGDIAMLSPDGFFEEDLATRIHDRLEDEQAVIAPIALSRGMLTSPDGSVQVANVQVLGVDERFWQLAPEFAHTPMGTWSIKKEFREWGQKVFFVNQRLAKRLKAEVGGRLILRMEEPSLFSRDAPLSGERDNKFVTMNEEFGGVVPAAGFGNFGLQGNQREPLTIFVSLQALQKKLFRSLDEVSGSTKFANFLLLGKSEEGEIDIASAKKAMDESWKLADAGIEIKDLRNSNEWSIRTRQVFLSEGLVAKGRGLDSKASGVLTYLVNAIEKEFEGNGSSLIPYSMMSAVEPGKVEFLGDKWRDDEIALNQWAANDLNATLGDKIKVSYYTVGERRKLIESSKEFILKKILPLPALLPEDQESEWTPRFPGLSDAESCGEWDTGIPIVHKVRDRDEEYWDEYRGTPKGFVSLKAGQEMWGNRWGSLTGLRIGKNKYSNDELAVRLRKNLKAEDAGLVFRGLRSDAKQSVESPVDFGQLFMGFSFFVITAVLAITGMLFTFSLEQRSKQIGLLRALGWKIRKIKMVFWGEGLAVAIIGSLIGVLMASFYGKAILNLLSGEWSGAVSGASFSYHATPLSIFIGGAASATVCLISMVWSARKILVREPRELLQSGHEGIQNETHGQLSKKWHKWVGALFIVGAIILAWMVGLSSHQASMSFFGAGGMLLIGGLFLFRSHLGGQHTGHQNLTRVSQLHRTNLGRRKGRGLVTVGSMAAGAFLVVSTGAFRKSPETNSESFRSGTGGFSFWGESASPIYDDLNGKEAMELFDLNESLFSDSQVIPLRLREGDDASCLNLNKALRPRIYGVKTSDFSGRFDFSDGNWTSLNKTIDGNIIPALVDQNTLMWALKMGLGDRIQYTDGEGRPFEIELVGAFKGSMLQGALFIKEEDFLNKFKQQGGYRSFMITGPSEDGQKLVNHLEDRLYQHGLEFRESRERLGELQTVENTYLSIFQGLGGLGMLIGTCGLGLVVARNLVERSQESALFEALGYPMKIIRKSALFEHLQLAIWGITIGSASAILGIAPALFGGVADKPEVGFLWFFLALTLLAFIWVFLAVFLTLRKSQLHLLRNE
ncbi:MAG: ABC transporter permease [Verrucomicrobiota bacterium]|nr:ABC transporter permease [Verrucomicrobiota bacterium]